MSIDDFGQMDQDIPKYLIDDDIKIHLNISKEGFDTKKFLAEMETILGVELDESVVTFKSEIE
jgi:hypothetical protein